MSNDLVGQKFGTLTVLQKAEDYIVSTTKRHMKQWLCKCDCGNIKIIREADLTRKNRFVSCGCIRYKTSSEKNKKYNTYDLSGEYGIGYTSKGEEFYFDLEDYDKIKDYCWFIERKGYVRAKVIREQKDIDGQYILFHKLLFPELNYREQIDHKNHNKSDNRKCNLRFATNSQNCINRGLQSNNTSGVTGVGWNKKNNKWHSYIIVKGKQIHLGYFNNFENAVKARKDAEEKYFGEWSYDNSMKTTSQQGSDNV